MLSIRAFLLTVLSSAALPVCAAEKPNVLFLAIDDQNDWIGYIGGHPNALTPNSDALAERGTAFTNAHCQSPLCNPSRTSLMTGLRPSTTGIYGLSPWIRTVEEFKDTVTLPQYFMRHGYRTFYTGKIYHGGNGRDGFTLAQLGNLSQSWQAERLKGGGGGCQNNGNDSD